MKGSTRRSPSSLQPTKELATWEKQVVDLIKNYCQENYSSAQKRMEGEKQAELCSENVTTPADPLFSKDKGLN